MSRIKLGWAALAFLSMLTATALQAEASPVNVYYDEADWKAAVKKFKVGPYHWGVTETDTTDTIVTGFSDDCPDYICLISSVKDTFPSGFSSFDHDFTFAAECEFDPGCEMTNTSDVKLVLDHAIFGFGGYMSEYATVQINGEWLGPTEPGGFIGVTGLRKFLDFTTGDYTDDPSHVILNDIVVATAVPEPPTWSLIGMLAAMMLGFRFAYRRRDAAKVC